MTKLRDRHGHTIDNLSKGRVPLTAFEGTAEHKCEECPLSLRCLSGRLTVQRGTYLCYKCGYMFVEDWIETVVPFADGQEAPMVVPTMYKFKCELRPVTQDIVRHVKRGSKHLSFISTRIPDPGPSDWLIVKSCPWCTAQDRERQ